MNYMDTKPRRISIGFWTATLLSAFVGWISIAGSAEAEYEIVRKIKTKTPYALTASPDGSVWVLAGEQPEDSESSGWTDDDRLRVYRIDKRGKRSRLRLATSTPRASNPKAAIAVGSDGNVWVALGNVPRSKRTTIFRMSPGGKQLNSYLLPSGVAVHSMAAAPDGRIWFLSMGRDRIGRISMSGRISSLRLKGARRMYQIVQGHDGDMWIAAHRKAIRLDLSMRKRKLAMDDWRGYVPISLARGTDRTMWFAGESSIKRLAADRTWSSVPLVYPNVRGFRTGSEGGSFARYPISLALRPDGLMGFTAGAFEYSRSSEWVTLSSLGVVSKEGIASETEPDESYQDESSRVLWSWEEDGSPDPTEPIGNDLGMPNRFIAGPDGRMWLSNINFDRFSIEVLRLDSHATHRPGIPKIATLRRGKHSVVLKVTCAGSPGRFCVGNVRLRQAGKTVARPRKYAVAVGDQLIVRFKASTPLRSPRGQLSLSCSSRDAASGRITVVRRVVK